MVFAVAGGGQLDTGGYQIDNSLRFNDNDSAYLSRTPSSAGNRRTWTWSGWFKRGNLNLSEAPLFHANGPSFTENDFFQFQSDDTLHFRIKNSNSVVAQLQTNQLFRDTSAWYHFVLQWDSTQATSSNRIKMYVNGQQITSFSSETYPSQNTETSSYNNTVLHTIGAYYYNSSFGGYLDGYLADVYFIDGQALDPTSFGEFDDSGIWKPIQYTGTYGTNGFYLDFENSGSLGADQSGNGNNFTPTNLASTDQTTDTPTNNFCTMSSIDTNGNASLSEGNTQLQRGSDYAGCNGTFGLSSGKWYWEVKTPTPTVSGENESFGVSKVPHATIGNNYLGINTNSWAIMIDNAASDIYKNHNNSFTDTGINASANDIFNIALDMDNNKVYFGRNGTYFDSGDPAAGTNPTYSSVSGDTHIYPAFSMNGNDTLQVNFGNAPFSISSGNSDDNGYGNFEYAPPSGYLALCTQNLATELSPTIDDGSEYFNTVLYTGNGTDNHAITGVGFQPDWFWVKERSSTSEHRIFDSSRGASRRIEPNNTNTETLDTSNMKSFDSDGFTLGTSGSTNENGQTYVAWNLLANGGSTSSNTDGDITTTVQASTTSGFSILTWTGNGTASQSIGHGLGITPKIMIQKNRDQTEGWQIFGSTLFDRLQFDTGAEDANLPCTFGSSTITLPNLSNNNGFNSSGDNFVSYVFAEIEGYSKFGSYTGNGSSDGPFVYTGFGPAFVMIKRTSSSGHWYLRDNKRDTYNPNDAGLYANLSNAEADTGDVDFLSNGFKLRNTFSEHNQSGQTYIYMAFAESPFVTSSGVPVVAR